MGFALTLIVFLWALNSGQFKDQRRARFLPLEEEPEPSSRPASRMNRYEIYVLGVLACAGLAASVAVLVFALYAGA